MIRTIRSTGVLLAMLVVAVGAQAALTIKTGLRTGGGTPSGAALAAHNDFLGLISDAATENFSLFDVGDPQTGLTLDIKFTDSASIVQNTAQISGNHGQVTNFFVDNTAHQTGQGRYDTTGTGDRFLQSDGPPIIITFTNAVHAFGFYGTDIGDFGNTAGTAFSVTLTDSNGTTSQLTLQSASAPDASLLFWGFVDTTKAYKSIQFNFDPTDGIGLDDMIVGNLRDTQPPQLPEPASIALGGLALLSLAALRRRKR